MSTVEPGRKPVETEPDFTSFIDQPEINDLKKSISEQNDSLHVKHIGNGKHIDSNDPSSSTQGDNNEIKKEDEKMDDDAVSDKLKEPEESVVKSEPQIEKDADDTPKTEEPVESKPVDLVEKPATDIEENNVAKPDVTESTETTEKTEKPENGQVDVEIKVTSAEEKTTEPLEEKKEDKDVKEEPAAKEPVEIEKASTPKRRSSGDDEDEDIDAESISTPSAKKIRLDLDEDEKEPVKTDSKPINEPVVPEPDLSKETDILESISTEIDAQKESELLDDVVDSALPVDKDPISIDVQPVADNDVVESETAKPAEEIPATDDLKVEEPAASIPSDLDFTPDEALNELVSSNILQSSEILSVVPAQPAVEEVTKMNDETAEAATVAEPVVAPAIDAMNVENTESSAPEVENAMEATPIKTDEEQMDVDESNSVDAMDL